MKNKLAGKIITFISVLSILLQSFSPFTALSNNYAYADEVASIEAPVLEEVTTTTIPATTTTTIPATTTTTIPELTITPTLEIEETTTTTSKNQDQNNATPETTTTIMETSISESITTTGNEKLQAVILENVSAPSLDLGVVQCESAVLTTDKADYAPTDTVIITGSNLLPSTSYLLLISSSNSPPVNFSANITSDEKGIFAYAYQLDGKYRPDYKVELKNEEGNIVASTTFTDSDSSFIAPNETISSTGALNPNSGWVSDNNYVDFVNLTDVVEYGFPDFNIPTGAAIEGIEVSIEGKDSGTTESVPSRNLKVALWNVSSTPDSYSEYKDINLNDYNDGFSQLGGSSDLWGKTWVAEDFNDTNFKIQVGVLDGTPTTYLDQIRIKVYYTETSVVFNGEVEGWIGADNLGVVSGSTTGAYDTTISGSFIPAEYIEGQKASFTGTISGAVNGSMIGGINWNGFDTLFGKVTGSGASGHVYLIGSFSGPMGHFTGRFVTQDDPINFVTEISITGGPNVELGSTLQMSASVLPEGASDEVAWSVWTGSGPSYGSAVIDQDTGLLTATGVGSVTVIASALDGSLVTKNYTVNITPDVTALVIALNEPIDGTIQSKEIHLKATCNEECDYVNFWWRAEGESYDSASKRYHYVHDNGTVFEWDLDSLNAEKWDGSNYTLSDGKYYIYVAGKDVYGNWARSQEVEFIVDNTAPNMPSFISPENNTITNINAITLKWIDGDDSLSGVKGYTFRYDFYPANGGAVKHWSSGFVPGTQKTRSGTFGHGEGRYEMYVKVTDNAGNVSSESSPLIITYDKTAPDVEITSPTSSFLSGTIPIKGTVTDANPHHYWLIIENSSGSKVAGPGQVNDSTSFINKSFFNWDTKLVPDGNYTIKLEARDSAENKDAGSSDWNTVTVDNTPPSTPTGIYFKDTKNNKNIYCDGLTSARNFDVYWNENTESDFHHYEYISYNADGTTGSIREFTTAYFNASWWTVPIEGIYGVQVRAVDKAGNKSEWSGGTQGFNNSCKYTSDWTSPTITNLSVDKTFVKAGGVIVINADVTDVSGIAAVSADFSYNTSYTNRPSPTSISMAHATGDMYTVSYTIPFSWNEGAMYIKVAARDKTGGNWIRSSETKTVEVDNTGPNEPVASPIAGDYDSDQIVTLLSSDTGSGLDEIYYTLDGTEPDKLKTKYTGDITIDHDLTLKAIAYDVLGNASSVFSGHYGVPPVIFGETSSRVDDTIAVVTWSTDDPSTSRVVYDTVSHSTLGSSPNFGYAYSTIEDSNKVASHSVTITGLTVGVTYYFRPVSHGSPEATGKEIAFTPHFVFGLPGDGLSDGGSDGRSDGGSTGGTSADVLGASTATLAYEGVGGVGGEVLGAETEDEEKEDEEKEEDTTVEETVNDSDLEKDVLGETTDISSSVWQNTFYRWLVIIIAIIVITTLLYFLFFKRKKNKEAS